MKIGRVERKNFSWNQATPSLIEPMILSSETEDVIDS